MRLVVEYSAERQRLGVASGQGCIQTSRTVGQNGKTRRWALLVRQVKSDRSLENFLSAHGRHVRCDIRSQIEMQCPACFPWFNRSSGMVFAKGFSACCSLR